MKRLVALAGVGTLLLLAPAGCMATLALGAGSIAAATTDPRCLSEETSDPTVCVPSWAQADPRANRVVIDPGGVPSPSLTASAAVEAAVSAVGRGGRYIAEGNGPVDFDCSGLTAFAWRAAGVRLVDYSYSQWEQTRRISREALAPGDLVFWFGGDVHHVALVVSVNGARVQIAEAANPDAGLRIRELGDSWDQAYLSGYGRVVV